MLSWIRRVNDEVTLPDAESGFKAKTALAGINGEKKPTKRAGLLDLFPAFQAVVRPQVRAASPCTTNLSNRWTSPC